MVWKITMSDRSEFIISQEEYEFLQKSVTQQKKLIMLRDIAVNVDAIRHIERSDIEYTEHNAEGPVKRSEVELWEDYEKYKENKILFKERLLGGFITGFPTKQSRDYYLRHNFEEKCVDFETFKKQYQKDYEVGFDNRYMTENFF